MTEGLARLKPAPLPAIHPVPEYLADEALSAVYADTKSVLQVPWMGVVTMAFAHYPAFFRTLWGGLRELAGSREFVEACRDLRAFAEAAASRLGTEPVTRDLVEIGYAERELEDIRALNEVFSHGNMPYLLIATAARLLLEDRPLDERTSITPYDGRHGPSSANRLLLIEAHHVDAPTAAVYESIKTTLGLPFVNTDYRAFARWPSYLARAWRGLSETVPTTTANTSPCRRSSDSAAQRAQVNWARKNATLVTRPGSSHWNSRTTFRISSKDASSSVAC